MILTKLIAQMLGKTQLVSLQIGEFLFWLY